MGMKRSEMFEPKFGWSQADEEVKDGSSWGIYSGRKRSDFKVIEWRVAP